MIKHLSAHLTPQTQWSCAMIIVQYILTKLVDVLLKCLIFCTAYPLVKSYGHHRRTCSTLTTPHHTSCRCTTGVKPRACRALRAGSVFDHAPDQLIESTILSIYFRPKDNKHKLRHGLSLALQTAPPTSRAFSCSACNKQPYPLQEDWELSLCSIQLSLYTMHFLEEKSLHPSTTTLVYTMNNSVWSGLAFGSACGSSWDQATNRIFICKKRHVCWTFVLYYYYISKLCNIFNEIWYKFEALNPTFTCQTRHPMGVLQIKVSNYILQSANTWDLLVSVGFAFLSRQLDVRATYTDIQPLLTEANMKAEWSSTLAGWKTTNTAQTALRCVTFAAKSMIAAWLAIPSNLGWPCIRNRPSLYLRLWSVLGRPLIFSFVLLVRSTVILPPFCCANCKQMTCAHARPSGW